MIDELLRTKFPSLAKYPKLRSEIVEISEIHSFSKNEIILREGEYIKAIPLLISGLVKVYREDSIDGEVLLYYINSGESCIMSMTSLINGEKSPVKGIVEQDAQILIVPAEKVLKIAHVHPGWNAFIYELFRNKYEELLHMITTLIFSNKDKLVKDYLMNLSDVTDTKTIRKTHQEIALDLGSTREVVSRILKKLENEGTISMSQGEIVLK